MLEERARIEAIASSRYGLDPAGVARLCEDAENTGKRSARHCPLYPVRSRMPLRTMIAWPSLKHCGRVVLADGTRAKEEDAVLRLVSNLLGVTDRDSAMARQRVTP